MMRLFGTELRRLLARRMFRYLALVGLGVLLLVGAFSFFHSSRNVAAAQAKARQQAADQVAQFNSAIGPGGAVIQCKSGPNAPPDACRVPTVDDIYQAIYQDPRYSFAGHAPVVVIGIVAAVALAGLVIGAGFIGAEWGSGTMAALLTWEPRRIRVLASKLITVIVVLVLAGVLAMLLALAGSYLIAATRGTTAGITHQVVKLIAERGARGLILIALLTGAGAALAGFTRHTVAALVTTVAYLVIVEIILRRFEPNWGRWLLTSNAGAVVGGSVRIFGGDKFVRGRLNTPEYVLHASRGVIYLVALFAALLLIWIVSFTRSDIDEGGGR
jgi:ABC-2 type transport system permease protein